MSYIVLEESLLNEFFKFYYKQEYEPKIIHNLFKHFKPFLITNKQIERFLSDDIAFQQAISTQIPYCEYIDIASELYTDDFYKEMLEKSKYKILLTKNASSLNTLDCHKICIKDKATHIYAKKFESGSNRDKAKKHIISLMKNANQITIIDKFLYKENVIDNLINWFNENNLNKEIEFILKDGRQQLSFDETKAKFTQQGYICVTCNPINDTTHDRYIIIDNKISINLTSGLENLFSKNKDFTYIISEK
ncbi:MAG: hypothetical protein K2N11_09840 [Mucispirillum sp.]|nr:hypothetical protein [Mucispirillum sp.]